MAQVAEGQFFYQNRILVERDFKAFGCVRVWGGQRTVIEGADQNPLSFVVTRKSYSPCVPIARISLKQHNVLIIDIDDITIKLF